MACVYYILGIDHPMTETLLDDFLQEKGKYKELFKDAGDLAFSKLEDYTTQSLRLQNIIETKIKPEGATAMQKARSGEARKFLYSNEEYEPSYKAPYMGTNRFLALYITKDGQGHRLFPEFIPDEFWSRRFKSWMSEETEEKIKFSDVEREVLFNNDRAAEEAWILKGYSLETEEGRAEFKRMREAVEYKWKQQADFGTAIHKVMQLFFNDPERTDLFSYMRSQVDLLTDDQLKEAILRAKGIYDLFESKYSKEGHKARYYTELEISQLLDDKYDGAPVRLTGIIDLLIIDHEGNPHIVDYKTSVKDYASMDDAKKSAFTYLLALYTRMLNRYDINTLNEEVQLIVPLEMKGFKKVGTWVDPNDNKEHDKWEYERLEGYAKKGSLAYVDLTLQILNNNNIQDNLDNIMSTRNFIVLDTNQFLEKVNDQMRQWFPKYGAKAYNDEDIKRIIEENGGYKKNDSGAYYFKLENSNTKEFIVEVKDGNEVEAQEKLFKEIQKYFQKRLERRPAFTQGTINALVSAMENPEAPLTFQNSKFVDDPTGTLGWFKNIFSRYYKDGADHNYELIKSDVLLNNGIIAIRNTRNNQIDIIKISLQNLYGKYRYDDKGRESLIGLFVNDLTEKRKSDSLIAMSTYGNIELMETMLAINNLVPNFLQYDNASIGRVVIANPLMNRGISMSNEELLYNYKRLNDYVQVNTDNILVDKSPIKFASRWTLLLNLLKDLLTPESYKKNSKYRLLDSCKCALEDTALTEVLDRIEELEKFIKLLQSKEVDFGMESNPEKQNLPEVRLYNYAVLALAEAKGIKFRQQIEKYGEWFQSVNIFTKGFNSLKFDNPGHMNNETLNLLAQTTMESYQGIRDDVQGLKPLLDAQVERLKNDKGFNKILEYTIGNLASMYTRMLRPLEETGGDLILKNPYKSNDLTTAENELLKFFLKEINDDRLGKSENFDALIKNDDRKYFMLPLTPGNLASRAAAKGNGFVKDLLLGVLDYLKYINPTYTYRKVQRGLHNVEKRLNDDVKEPKMSDDLFFLMTNTFDKGNVADQAKRIELINHPLGVDNTTGNEYWERNLETILLKHRCAYSTQRRVNANVPIIKAALIHLTTMGANQNSLFTNEIKYIRDYFKNKIKGESLVDPKMELVNTSLTKLREAASLMTLGIAPVQYFYLLLDGMWKDISLIIRKPDGTQAFTFANMTAAGKDALWDMFAFGKKTKAALLNQLYGLNDMDMNVYFDKIKSDQWGLYNWRSLAFYSASRPDFYNRLTIFGSLMRADGTWDAHEVVNGKLVYNFSKDTRFDRLARNDHSDEKLYQSLKGFYLAMAREFIKEGARNPDGTLFQIGDINNPNPLPRAYTTKQAESMKSLADNLYGFYSHERKSMILATTIGALWMLYRTYWSGKKNQYLEHGGIKLRGKWVQAVKEFRNSDGTVTQEKMFDIIDENGMVRSVRESEVPQDKAKIPTVVWQGDWEEGIALTFVRLMLESMDLKSFITAWLNITNDPDFGKVYTANLEQLLYDVTMFGLIGSITNSVTGEWLKELAKEKKGSADFVDALQLAAANVAARSLSNSFLDFNFFESIGSPGVTWNPFAFTWALNEAKHMYNTAFGDETIMQMIMSGSGAMKQTRPIWDWVDLQVLHDGDKTLMPAWKRTHKENN